MKRAQDPGLTAMRSLASKLAGLFTRRHVVDHYTRDANGSVRRRDPKPVDKRTRRARWKAYECPRLGRNMNVLGDRHLDVPRLRRLGLLQGRI